MYLGKKKRTSLISTIWEITSLKKNAWKIHHLKKFCAVMKELGKKSLSSQGREYKYSKQREAERQIGGLWKDSM